MGVLFALWLVAWYMFIAIGVYFLVICRLSSKWYDLYIPFAVLWPVSIICFALYGLGEGWLRKD